MTRLPGFPYKGKKPRGFDSRDQVIKHFERYTKSFKSPIIKGAHVISVTQNKVGFIVKTKKEMYNAKNVVVAIGSFHKPLLPKINKLLSKETFQIHSSEFKNSKQLPKGAVLIVGGGNSGVQIAVDLEKSGRKVYLSLGRLRIVPRTYLGKDFMEWAEIMGALDKTTEEATPEIKATLPPILFGYNETVNFRKLAKNGIKLMGRLTGFKDGKYFFDKDLVENIEKGETSLAGFKDAVDKFIADKKLKTPKENVKPEIKYNIEAISEFDATKNQIKSVIWATGFKDDYSWLKLPVFDKNGEPIHRKGVSKLPGLYFMGLRWLSKYKSFLLCGVAEDAEYIVNQIKN